jgi:hypothetical protein
MCYGNEYIMYRVYLEMNAKVGKEHNCKIQLNIISYATFASSCRNSVYAMFKIGIYSY